MSFDADGPEPSELRHGRGIKCVRDVSWHSQVHLHVCMAFKKNADIGVFQEPVMMSAAGEWDSWDAVRGSVVARHDWKGLSKLAGRLEDWVEKDQSEREHRQRRYGIERDLSESNGWHVPGAFE
jgi:DDB1- and CUL4-associated factor 11